MKRLLLALVAVLLSASSLGAQGVTATSVTITNQTTGISTTTALTGVVCGQVKPTGTLSTVNPRRIIWDDSTNATLACIWTDPGTGVLVALPFGPASYIGTVTASNSAGSSPPSLPSLPFTRPGSPPGAPTGLLVIQ